MKNNITPSEIVAKLKKDYQIKESAQLVLLDLILESLISIESVNKAMVEESERKHMRAGVEWSTPYGFIQTKIGDLKPHPGNTIKKDAENNIKSCLKQLGIKTLVGAVDEPKKDVGVMGKLTAMK